MVLWPHPGLREERLGENIIDLLEVDEDVDGANPRCAFCWRSMMMGPMKYSHVSYGSDLRTWFPDSSLCAQLIWLLCGGFALMYTIDSITKLNQKAEQKTSQD